MYTKSSVKIFCSGFVLFFFVVASGLLGCSYIGVGELHQGGTVKLMAERTINGLHRTALVHIPNGYEEQVSYPLVIVLHGAFSTAAKMEEETGFSDLADKEGFVVVYPNGMGIFGLLQHWNSGHCCGKAAADGLDDVAFLEECIALVKGSVNINEKKVFIAGFSNGGMMAHRFAAEKSSSVAALAALGASVGGRADAQRDFWIPPIPEVPVPALLIHGMADTAVPPEGGISQAKGGTREYLSLAESTAFWVLANRCDQNVDSVTIDNGRAEKKLWRRCADSSSVEVYMLHGLDHQWPGRYYSITQDEKTSFGGTELIWKFFQRHSR